MRYDDLMELANDTTRKAVIRERIGKRIASIMNEDFNSEYVRFLAHDIGVGANGSKIPKGTILVDVGEVLDKDKCSVGAIVEISVKVKNWNSTSTARNPDRQAVTMVDIDIGIETAEKLAKIKEENDRKKKENKEKAIARAKR